MATQALPSDVMLQLEVETSTFRLKRQREQSSDGNGNTFTIDLADPVWTAKVQVVPMYHEEAEQRMARIEDMEDQMALLYVWNPAVPFPQSDADGSILGEAVVTILSVNADTNKHIALQGLPVGYVLTQGDKIEVEYNSPPQRALYSVVDDTVTAGGDGKTAQFQVSPFIRPGLTTGDGVNLVRPKCAMKIIPGSLDCPSGGDSSTTSRITFDCIEQPDENI